MELKTFSNLLFYQDIVPNGTKILFLAEQHWTLVCAFNMLIIIYGNFIKKDAIS
jgi:hypothetical protein